MVESNNLKLSTPQIRAILLLAHSGWIENAWGVWSSPDYPEYTVSASTISSLVCRGLAIVRQDGGHGHQIVYLTQQAVDLVTRLTKVCACLESPCYPIHDPWEFFLEEQLPGLDRLVYRWENRADLYVRCILKGLQP